eukprot:633104-Pelagomonas_calceolata.AAC.1
MDPCSCVPGCKKSIYPRCAEKEVLPGWGRIVDRCSKGCMSDGFKFTTDEDRQKKKEKKSLRRFEAACIKGRFPN